MKFRGLFTFVLIFNVAYFQCAGQHFVQIPDSILYVNIRSEFNHIDSSRSIDTTHCRPGWWQMNFGYKGITNFYGVQFLKCKTGYYSFSRGHQKELIYFPPGVERLDCSRNEIRYIGYLPQKLLMLGANDNLIEHIDSLPSHLKVCNIMNNKLTSLPSLPQSLEWINYIGNPIDTMLLPKEYKDNPCLYANQNCLPKKKQFTNLFGAKVYDTFNSDDITSIEIKVTGNHSWGAKETISTYYYRINKLKFICDSVIYITKTDPISVKKEVPQMNISTVSVKKILKHIINGDKTLPLIDIQPSDTSKQIIDFYRPFDGENNSSSGCQDCSRFTYEFLFRTSTSNYSFSNYGDGHSPESFLNTTEDPIVFDVKQVAEWMYAHALASQLLPEKSEKNVQYTDGYFTLFKKRMKLK